MTATAIGSYATASAMKTLAGITDSTDDTLIGLICDRVNAYIERKTGRVLGPISSATYYYDGDGGKSLFLPKPENTNPIGGIRAITTLSIAQYTNGPYIDIVSTDYFLRQSVGITGPYEMVYWSDYPTSGYGAFPKGYNTVKIVGTAGWAAVPDDITDVALTAAVRAWGSRQSGQVDIVGSADNGQPTISRFFSARDLETLRAYTLVGDLA